MRQFAAFPKSIVVGTIFDRRTMQFFRPGIFVHQQSDSPEGSEDGSGADSLRSEKKRKKLRLRPVECIGQACPGEISSNKVTLRRAPGDRGSPRGQGGKSCEHFSLAETTACLALLILQFAGHSVCQQTV